MQPIKGKAIEVPGHSIINIDLKSMMGNVAGVFTAGNRRGAFRAGLSLNTVRDLLDKASANTAVWIGKQGTPLQTETKKRILDIEESIRAFIVEMVQLPEAVSDIGHRLQTETSQCDAANRSALGNELDWTCEYNADPSTGYPRLYTRPNLETGVEPFDGTVIPAISGEWSKAIATYLINIDRGVLSLDLIKPPDKMSGHDPKEQPFGQLYSLIQQVRNILEWLTLMLVQGPCLFTHVHHRINRATWEFAYATEHRARAALDTWWENYEFLEKIKLHSILTPIANGLKTGTLDTPMGIRDILYLAGHGEMPDEHKSVGGSSRYSQTRMAHVLNAALWDYGQAGEVDVIWGNFEVKKRPYMTIGEAVRVIRSLDSLINKWDKIAGELKWVNLSGDVGQINVRGADFILTDGRDYSDSPYGGLLGLRPVLSAGNVKIAGYSNKRFEETFNIKSGRIIDFSVMVVDGFQGATANPSMHERHVMPASMSMGEADVSHTFAETMLGDGIGRAAYDWYTSQQQEYVEPYYPTLDEPTATLLAVPGLKATDWGGQGSGKQPREATNALLAYYAGSTRPFSRSVVVETASRFYHRFIVKMARGRIVTNYDELWNLVEESEYEGSLQYNGEVTINVSTNDLEAIVKSLPMRVTEQTGLPPPAGGDQIKVTSG